MIDLGRMLNYAELAALCGDGVGGNGYRLGAVLFDKKGNIICAKPNVRKTHPALRHFSPYPYLHAECHCILANGIDRCGDCSLLVCRITRLGSVTMARPCKMCMEVMGYAGIRKVYYTDWKGELHETSP